MSTPTPRTDAEYARYPVLDTQSARNAVLIEFPRTLETELTTALARVAELEKEVAYQKAREEADRLVIRDLSEKLDSFDNELSQVDPICDSLTRQLSEAQESLRLSQHDAAQERLRIVKLEGLLSESQAQLADTTDAWDNIFDSRRINGMSHSEAAKALIARNEKLQEENELLNQLVRGGSCLSCAELQAQLTSAREDGARLDWLASHHVEFAEELHRIGWKAPNDAQWEKLKFFLRRIRHAIDSARGHLSETQAGGETGKEKATRWSYSSYRATLKLDGKSWAIVSPDGRNALSAADAALLERAMNALDASLLPPPPQGKETK